VKKPSQFLERLKVAKPDDHLARFVLDGLSETDRQALSRQPGKDEAGRLKGEIEKVLAKAGDDQLNLLNDDAIGTDGVYDVDDVLRQEYKQIFGGTFYIKDPEKLVAGATDENPGVFSKVRDLFKSEDLTTLKNAVGTNPSVLANGIRKI